MTELSDTVSPIEGTQASESPRPRERQKFTWRHALAIAFALGLTVAIFALQGQIRELEKLSYFGGFLAMLIGNATIILPVPALIFIFSLGNTLNPLLVGLIAGPGAALGEMSGYIAGYGGSAAIDDFDLYHRIRGWMQKYGLVVISVLAAVPNPVFDMAGIVAGSLRIKWWKFLIAALIGKTIQAILVAYAGALSLGWVEQLIAH